MRKNMTIIGLVVLMLATAGCGGGLFLRQERLQEVVTTIPAATNLVAVPQADGTTNLVVSIRPAVAVTNWTTNIVFEPNPAVLTTIRTAREVNDLVNPMPFSGAVSGFLGLLAVGLGYLAKVKTDRAKLIPAIIQGVELAKSPEVKASIQQVAKGLGLERKLNAVVQEVTR